MKRLIMLVGAIILVLVSLLWVLWPSSQTLSEKSAMRQAQPEPRDVVLYFIDPAGFSLVSEEQQIAGCNDERQCVAQTLEALAAGSLSLQPVMPERTRVLGVEIEGDLARINFSRDLINGHPGGSLSELLTVYGLTNTLTVNFPSLHRLQILVDGEVESTLRGHVDISRPIKAEFRYSHVPEPQAEIGPVSDTDSGSPVSEAVKK